MKRRTLKKRASRVRRTIRLARKWLDGHHTRLDAHVRWLNMQEIFGSQRQGDPK